MEMSSYSGPLDREDGNLFMTVQRRNRVLIQVVLRTGTCIADI